MKKLGPGSAMHRSASLHAASRPGHIPAQLSARNAEQYLQAGWSEGAALMRFAIVIEQAEGNYSA
jgi:hypothetical protein